MKSDDVSLFETCDCKIRRETRAASNETMRSLPRNILISGGLLLAVKASGALAFMLQSEPLRCPLQRRSGHRYRRRTRAPTDALTLGGRWCYSRLLATSSDTDGEDDDGGWGAPSSSKSDQERELAALQAERAERSAPSTNNSARQANEPPERDLFIPIFALVSLAGLFGSYGYEMLRLYSRGELYLPWDQ